MNGIEGLGWEQLVALRVLRDTPDIEGSDLCIKSDMSFDELGALGQRGLIDLGAERLHPKTLHPVLLPAGVAALDEAVAKGIL